MPRSHQDPAISHRNRLDLFKIRRDLVKVRLGLAISSDFWQNPADIHTTRNRPRTNLNLAKIQPPKPTPFTVGNGSKNGKPEMIGSVPGWAQTRPGLTRGQPYRYALFLLLLLLFSFCLFSLVLLLIFCLHVIIINEFKTFKNIVKFLKASSLFLYFVFIKLITFCLLVAFCLN